MISNFKVDRSRNDYETRFLYRDEMYGYTVTFTVPTLFDEKEHKYLINTDEDVSDEYIKKYVIKLLMKDLEPKE